MPRASIPLHHKAKAQGFSAGFVCLKAFSDAEGYHPIRLQLIHNRRVKRFSTGQRCKLQEWDANMGRVNTRAKGAPEANRLLNALAAQVGEIVDALLVHGTLSLETFEARYRKPKATGDMIGFLGELEERYRNQGRLSTATTFRNAASAFRRFHKGRPIRFADVTARKLEDLESFLRAEGCTAGGIGSYMRTIRVAINTAIKEGHMSEEQYPFETARNKGFSMKRLKSEHNPRALSEGDMDKLKRFPFDEAPHLALNVRLFLLSYYARGMNFTDMAKLKRTAFNDGRLTYRRSKTGDPFSILVQGPLAELLNDLDTGKGPYLLPFLGAEHVTAAQQRYRIQKCLQQMNRDLKEAAAFVGISGNLTSYVARHTYANTLKMKGVNTETISEALGHESLNTTRAYLRRFSSEVIDATDVLL